MRIFFNIPDLMLSGVIILMIALGIFRGFLREVLSLVFLGITSILSFIYYLQVSNLIFKNSVQNDNLSDFLGFFTLWMIFTSIGFVVSFIYKKKIYKNNLEKSDRIMGGIIGCIRGIITTAVICYSISLFGLSGESISRSSLITAFSKILDNLISLHPINLLQSI
jgi:membrane protein required for colicin V production